MNFVINTRYWLLAISMFFSLGCTRELGPTTKLKFSLPQTGFSTATKGQSDSLQASSNNTWGLTNPNSFSELNCYAVFVSTPEAAEGQCLKSDGTVAFSANLMAGLYPAGSTVELDAPAGQKRTIRLVGFKSSTAAACGTSLASGLNFSSYSAPFEVGRATVDLAPNVVNNVTILASLTSNGQFHSCSGGKLGSFGPSSSGGGTTPQPLMATLTGVPSAASNATSLSVAVGGSQVVAYQYKISTSGGASCTIAAGYSADIPVANLITDSLTGYTDGSLTLCVIGKDASGTYQTLAQSTVYSWTKDTNNPTVAITSPAPGSLVNLANHTAVSLSGTCSENGQSVVISDAGSASAVCFSGVWTVNVNVSSASDGSINLQANHSDLAGNLQTASVLLNKDTQGPTSASVQIAGGAASTPTTSVTLNLTASDAFEMYVTDNSSCSAGGTWEAFSTTKAWILAGGATGTIQNVYVKFRDIANNETACLSDSISYDTPAVLSISNAPVFDYGTIANGGFASFSFTLQNYGGLTATGLSGGGIFAPFSFLGGTYPGTGGTCGATLSAGASCTVIVAFSPPSSNLYNDTLTIDYHDGVTNQQATRDLQGVGAPPAVVQVSIDPYDFGTQALGSTTTVTLTYSNSGGVSAQYTSATTSGAFQFVGGSFPGTGGTCNTTSIPAGNNCTVVVQYSPGSTGFTSQNLVYNYFDGASVQAETSQLQGTGAIPAQLALSEVNPYNFGQRGIGFNVTHVFTLTNSGGFIATSINEVGLSAPYQFTGGTFPGTSGTCSPNLAAGASCTLQVQFNPTAPGSFNDAIEISYFDGAAPQTATRNLQGQSFEPYSFMALGQQHSCARLPNSNGRCWGDNTNGQLGNGSTTASLPPVPIGGGIPWTQLSAKSSHTCGVDAGSNGYCWGANTNGQLGDGTTTQRLNPMALPGGSVWQKIVTGISHSCGLRTSGTIMCWGSNTYGQLGDNTTTQRLTPTSIMNGGPFIDIAAGNFATCAVTSSQNVVCWGRGDNGELGNGTISPTNNPMPAQVSISVSNYVKVTMGLNFTCALRSAGGMVDCWGNGTNGQLGDGNSTSSVAGVVTPAVSAIDKIEAGDGHVCAFKGATNQIYCWGLNTYGQLGIGSVTTQAAPVSVGSGYIDTFVGRYNSCGLTEFGGTRCWGFNSAGQLGTGDMVDRTSPFQINP